MLFEGDLARPGHLFYIETSNKQGECVLKTRCHICRTLISYHNSSWICTTTRVRSHNITIAQDIAATDALAFEFEATGKPFPIHKLPTPPVVKKEPASNVALMRCTFAALSYGPNTQPYNQIKQTIAKWIATDCLLYRTVEMRVFRAMMRSLDLKCPNFSRKTITFQVGHCPNYYFVLPTIINIFFPSLK